MPGFDYAEPGYYFVTINTNKKRCYFGEVIDSRMVENDAGRMVRQIWQDLSSSFPNIEVDISRVMPNHLHGILIIRNRNEKGLGDYIGAFKSHSTVEYIKGVNSKGWPAFESRLWQRNYFEHVIRHDQDYERIHQYIDFNGLKWDEVHKGIIT